MNKIIEKKQVCSAGFTLDHCFDRKCHQMQDFLKMYANIVEKCFNTCCNDFTSKALSSKEVWMSQGFSECAVSLTHSRKGCLRRELHRKVVEALRAGRSEVCGVQRR